MTRAPRSGWLGGEILGAAEAFFGTDLSDVRLHIDESAAALGAVAYAQGNEIHMSVDGAGLASVQNREILGHELMHVIQQRQGRATPTLLLNGLLANDDAELEREAEEVGRRFARGEPSVLPPAPLTTANPPVIQRIVSVGGKVHAGQSALSPAGAMILKLIEGGEEWLGWVVTNQAAHYSFAGEGELLRGVQEGLHGATLVLLRRLGILLHPDKLRELSDDELKTLLAVEQGSESNSVATMSGRKTLAAHELCTQSELVIGEEFLVQTGVDSQPLFQAMSLSDRIALFELVNGASTEVSLNPAIQKEAAAFSARWAQTPKEFVDYYQFYVSTLAEGAAPANQAAKRGRLAEAAVDALTPLLYNLLWCPSVQGASSVNDVVGAARNWVAKGNRLGFARLSAALWQVNQYVPLKGATGEAAEKVIAQYMDQIQNIIVQSTPRSARLSQDGEDCSYRYDSQPPVELCLSSDGNLTLSGYRVPK